MNESERKILNGELDIDDFTPAQKQLRATYLHKKRNEPIDSTGLDEITVAVIGSVDSGKSSTVGTLVTGMLDDGNGLSRSIVFVHPHERFTGRTSAISYQYHVDEISKRIITFVDLAGHETYLKTTINGLTASYPDFAIVCISDKITKMTKEHMGLCIALNIPFVILFTKMDMIPTDITAGLIVTMKRILLANKRRMVNFKTLDDFKTLDIRREDIVPFFTTSNKTGENLDLVKNVLRTFKKRQRQLLNGFIVEHIYHVQGHGTVLSGVSGEDIRRGDTLYMGPFSKGDFVQVTVRSIHNDYRFDINTLAAGKKGCLAIGFKSKDRPILRKGMILSKIIPDNIRNEFDADVEILHHHTTIKPNYKAYINCGMLREAVCFVAMFDANGQPISVARSGDKVRIRMRFMKNLNYIESGQQLAFREGLTRGVGIVV